MHITLEPIEYQRGNLFECPARTVIDHTAPFHYYWMW
jgi:hypothetical protein